MFVNLRSLTAKRSRRRSDKIGLSVSTRRFRQVTHFETFDLCAIPSLTMWLQQRPQVVDTLMAMCSVEQFQVQTYGGMTAVQLKRVLCVKSGNC